MYLYALNEHYQDFFIDKEELLIDMIKNQYKQLDMIIKEISSSDFTLSLFHFYHNDQYEIKNNTIIYTDEITQEKMYCSIYKNYLKISELDAFSLFLERYFNKIIVLDDNFCFIKWFSYKENHNLMNV